MFAPIDSGISFEKYAEAHELFAEMAKDFATLTEGFQAFAEKLKNGNFPTELTDPAATIADSVSTCQEAMEGMTETAETLAAAEPDFSKV